MQQSMYDVSMEGIVLTQVEFWFGHTEDVNTQHNNTPQILS